MLYYHSYIRKVLAGTTTFLIHSSLHRFLARALVGTLTLSEWAMTGLSTLPAAVAAFLIVLIYSTCGALSLCVGAAFFLLKVCMMSAICSMLSSSLLSTAHAVPSAYVWELPSSC
jgi:hypothetical protein